MAKLRIHNFAVSIDGYGAAASPPPNTDADTFDDAYVDVAASASAGSCSPRPTPRCPRSPPPSSSAPPSACWATASPRSTRGMSSSSCRRCRSTDLRPTPAEASPRSSFGKRDPDAASRFGLFHRNVLIYEAYPGAEDDGVGPGWRCSSLRQPPKGRSMYQNASSIRALILLGFVSACCDPAVIGSQAVTLRPQETSMWCWAASGEMVMDFLGTDVGQCDEANKRFGRSDCCNNPVPNACVNEGWPSSTSTASPPTSPRTPPSTGRPFGRKSFATGSRSRSPGTGAAGAAT